MKLRPKVASGFKYFYVDWLCLMVYCVWSFQLSRFVLKTIQFGYVYTEKCFKVEYYHNKIHLALMQDGN